MTLDRYFGLAGNAVLLTGGTRDIGRAMAACASSTAIERGPLP